MKTLLFLSRVTFIYNLCMVVTMLTSYVHATSAREIKSSIIVAGLFLSIVFNGLVHVWMLITLLEKKSIRIFTPAWLFIANFLCFIYQIYMLLK